MTLTHDVCILFFVPIEIGNALTHGLVQPLTTSLTLALGGNTTAIDDFPAHLAETLCDVGPSPLRGLGMHDATDPFLVSRFIEDSAASIEVR